MKHSATPIRGILVTLSFILITLFNQLLAHVWEIRVNQNQDGSLTWYLQSYHTTSECGISNSGININGTNYPLQNNFTGSIQLLSNNIFTLSPSYANNNSARVSYATVTTPYISGSLNVTAYSNNVCWAAYFDMPVSNPNFRPQASALDFNGNTNYLNAGSSFLNNLSQFTIEGRIYYTGTASQSLFGQNDVLETSISGGQIEIWNPNFSLSVNHDMVINTWNHIAYVGNGSSITIYINGVQKGFLNHAIISNYSSSTHPVTIGSYTGDYIGGNAAPFNGKMDEIRFWNIARCQGEILNSLNCELSTINSSVLLAYYKLNQGFENSDNTAINIANDVSGNLRNASLVNFSLIGTTSNWTFGGVTGSCSSFSQSIMASNNGPVNTGSTLNLTATHTGTATYNWTGPNGFTSSVQNPSISNVQPNYSGIYSLSAVINGCSPVYSSTNVTINPPATALHFDGLNDNIELSNQFNNLSDITLAVWVKLNSYGSNGTGFSEIWSKESSNAFSINNSTRKFHVNFGNGTSWGTAIESSTIIPLNTWTHLAATRDALGNVKIYINGILNNSGNALNSLSGTNLLQHTVGCKQTPSGKTGFLNGSIDDLKVWSKALCESEINNNKNCEITTAQNNLILYLKLNNGFVNANNSGLITAIDYSGNGYNGTLIGFSLNGTTSNWTSGYVTGNCSAFSYPTINSFSGSQSICNGQSTTLTAHSSSPSPIFKWYDAALGGTLLFTGASYTTPILTANTNYYVEVSSLDCFSGSRTPVTVTVNPIPTITSTNTPQVRCGAGVVNLTATSSINSSTFNWYNAASGGASLFTGATYSPSISLNTTYYVATTSPQGCTSVARTPVVASVGPIYTANSSQCVNSNSFTFYNGCEVVGATYKWNFGDNTPIVSSLINTPQTHVYNAAGNYQVTLITTLNGIDSYSSMYVSVNPMPVASFVTYVNTGNGSSYSFQSSSTIQGGSMSYAWAFGDGNTGIGDNVQHIYANSGNKNVTLTVTSNAGCVNSTTSSINVIIAGSGGGSGGSGSGGTGGSGTNITPSFIVNNLQQCLTGNSFIFTNNSTYPSGTTFLWIFNDGTTYNGVTPLAKTYSTAGNYNVQLKATFNGNDYFTNQQVIVKPMPVAGFTYTNTGLQYSFTNTSTLSQGSMSYDWNINGSTVSTSQNIQATLNSGTNTVTLNATSDGGCTNSYGPISINASGSGGSGGGTIAPVSGITLSSGTQTQCLNGNSFTFSPNVSGGTPSTYQWYFQNATASSSTAAGPHTVTFSQPGTHTVQLYVSNSAGNSTATYNVTITDAPQPTIAAGSTTYFCDGGSVTLTSSAATSYQWYKDAVLISGATAQTYAATTAGVYTVVATYSGCASVASNGNSVTVVAAPSQPTIATSGATTFCNGSSVTLTSSTGNSYQWYLNGSTISGANGSTYNATATGNYTVAITNSNGCTSIQSTATSVTVNPAATTPVITASGATTFCAPASVTLSSTVASSYQWYKNGVIIPGATNQTLIADSSKTYTVITGNGGACPSAVSNAITVSANPKPVASYVLYLNTALVPTGSTDTTKKCFVPGDDFSYQSSSTIPSGTMTYLWSFAGGVTFRDGSNISYINPRVIFDTAGTYPVKLKVTSDKGCVDSVTRMVYLSDPHAQFNPTLTYSPDIYANPTVNVNNASYDYGGILSYNWSFGGGGVTNSNVSNPAAFTYNAGGTYNINLTITSNAGCVKNVSRSVNIVIRPKAQISVKTTVVAIPNPLGIPGTANYKSYHVTGITNAPTASTIVTGSIVSSLIEIDYYHSPSMTTVTNWVSTSGAPFTDVQFSVPEANQADYKFTIRLYVTSNLGVTNMTSMTIENDDKTGGNTYSRGINNNVPVTIAPEFISNQIEKLLVYPNPSRDFVKVNFKTPVSTKNVTIKVISMYGKLVQQQTNSNSSNQTFNLNISNLASGTYTILIEDENGKILGNSKIIKAMN